MRLQVSELCVVEQKPDLKAVEDLRLNAPFHTLQSYTDSIDWASLGDNIHSHIPFIVILVRACELWRSEHDGAMPKDIKEKDAFRAMVRGLRRSSKELNFDEAVDNAFKCF